MVSQSMLPRVISWVPGPIEPTTKRGRSGVAKLSQALRAVWAASTFSSCTRSTRSWSSMVCSCALKLSVSTASDPAAKKSSWIFWMTSGRVSSSTSVQFSRPK